MKKIALAILLTLLTNILCLPLWTEYDYGGFVRTLFNKEARVDLLYQGRLTGTEPFLFEACPAPVTCSHVYGVENPRRTVLVLRAREKWQKLSLQLRTLQDGKITMMLSGPEERDELGKPYSVLTDWKNLRINGKIIFKDTKTLSLVKGFSNHILVKRGEVFRIETEFRRHPFSIHDFKLLESRNFWFFISGNLLFFFFLYRLLVWMDIRGGGTKKSDDFLLIAFFSCLLIPMIFSSNEVRSQREGRMLAAKPEMKEALKEKSDCGGKYEQWFNDHMGGRSALLELHDRVRNKFSRIIRSRSNGIYISETGWFLNPSMLALNFRPFIQPITQSLFQLNRFCQQNKIKLYIFEVPTKESVYKELFQERFGFNEKAFVDASLVQETIRNETRKKYIPYIYPYGALRIASKQDFVYYKWTWHWTDWGAFVGYRELMKEINKDFPDMPVVSLSDCRKSQNRLIRDGWHRQYELGYTGKYFNFSDDPPNRALYNYYDHKNADKLVIQVGRFTKDFSYQEGRYKVMLIGSSQNDSLIQFLPYSAAETKYIRLNMGQTKAGDWFKVLKLYKKDILDFKPDILILSFQTDNLHAVIDTCSTK